MTSSTDSAIRSCLVSDQPPTALGPPVVYIARHAIEQCMKRCQYDREPALALMLFIAKEGVPWTSPKGDGLRMDGQVVGVSQFVDVTGTIPKGVRSEGLAVTTYYRINQDGALQHYADEVKAQNRQMRPQSQKPGRQRAWSRLRRQGKHCRRPPVPAEQLDVEDPLLFQVH